mgnify:CR=1 FL=1
MNRRDFILATAGTLAAASTTGQAAEKPLTGEVGIVAATLGAHTAPGKKGGLALNDLPRLIRQELGMRVIDMNTMNFASLTPKIAEQFRAAADREGCVLTNLKLNQRNVDLAGPDAAKRKHALETYQRSVDAAKLMGMKWVRPLPRPKQGDRRHLLAGLRALDDYAGERGLRVLIENFGWMQADANSVANLIRDLGGNLPASPDTGNWNSNPIRYEGLAKSFPLAVTCDFKAKTLGAKGEHPQYDLQRCFQIGWDAGFRGPWCIEHGHKDLPTLIRNLKMIKGMLDGWMRKA